MFTSEPKGIFHNKFCYNASKVSIFYPINSEEEKDKEEDKVGSSKKILTIFQQAGKGNTESIV
jgi:hypothetical protein